MDEESTLIDCDTFATRSEELWQQLCDQTQTQDPEAWDKAFELYAQVMDELRQSYGHRPRRPGQRPH